MKKIVRLTESDIVRLVKKVLNENKKILSEDEKIGFVSVGVVDPVNKGLLSVSGEIWKMKLPNQNGNNQYLVVKGIWRDGTDVCIGNDDWGWITKYCLNQREQDEFAGGWWDAHEHNKPKFTLGDGRLEFIRQY
jgi:hypothetical protein